MTDWYMHADGIYYRGTQEQVSKRSLAAARRIGQERAGWYYLRLLPTRQTARGPFGTMREAMEAGK